MLADSHPLPSLSLSLTHTHIHTHSHTLCPPQVEDMCYENSSKMLSMYSNEFPIFSDDQAGTAAAVLACVLAAAPRTQKSLKDHVFLFSGEQLCVYVCVCVCE